MSISRSWGFCGINQVKFSPFLIAFLVYNLIIFVHLLSTLKIVVVVPSPFLLFLMGLCILKVVSGRSQVIYLWEIHHLQPDFFPTWLPNGPNTLCWLVYLFSSGLRCHLYPSPNRKPIWLGALLLSFLFCFNRYLLSTFYVPVSDLGNGGKSSVKV